MSLFPTETEVQRLNVRIADLLRRSTGLDDPQLLRAILLGVRISRSSDGPHADVFHRAGSLLHQMVSLKPFRSINGATALGATLLYLSRHGYGVAFGKGQAASLVKGVVIGTMDPTRIASMFRVMAGMARARRGPPLRSTAGSRT